jgi:lipopolysaccharide transport system ATP-binding protein
MIKAENISKVYRLGTLGSGRLREDLKEWWERRASGSGMRKGIMIGQGGAAEKGGNGVSGSDEGGGGRRDEIGKKGRIWALKDINFEVERGEVLGFIGKNGAGKSTLLKIISRITRPTTGSIRGNGKIASLLEVGTGFHGELTGRENIFLNGHILGMKKKEIETQFDRIIDFSGVEAFIDTPVKRYSSGMYVRLAFAVAAHLNPEILIVDEVLAVGDAEFQQKCIGKMKEVSVREGRTVLFVSHNLQALRNLCHRAITLHQGMITDIGHPDSVIANYLNKEKSQFFHQSYDDAASAPGNGSIRIKKVQLSPEFLPGMEVIDVRTPLAVDFEFWFDPTGGLGVNGVGRSERPASVGVTSEGGGSEDRGNEGAGRKRERDEEEDDGDLIVGIHLFGIGGDCVFDVASPRTRAEKGIIGGQCRIPGNFLNDGAYYISIVFVKNTTKRLFYFESCLSFEVEDFRDNTSWYGKWIGHVRPGFPVTLQQQTNIF